MYITFLMNIISMHSISSSSFLPLKQPSPSPLLFGCRYHPHNTHLRPIKFPPLTSPKLTHTTLRSPMLAPSTNEGTISVFEDFVDKDWSFLETDDKHNIDRIISAAGGIGDTSKVMVCIGSEAFVDRLVYSSPCQQLLIVHDSLFTLACIKERYDYVKCWQGQVITLPDKWTAFDVVFLYFLPALPFQLHYLLAALSNRCLPGARLVISHPQGRQVVQEQKQLYPDVVVSDLPEKTKLQSIAADHSFEVVEFEDESGFYLAVLRLNVKSEHQR